MNIRMRNPRHPVRRDAHAKTDHADTPSRTHVRSRANETAGRTTVRPPKYASDPLSRHRPNVLVSLMLVCKTASRYGHAALLRRRNRVTQGSRPQPIVPHRAPLARAIPTTPHIEGGEEANCPAGADRPLRGGERGRLPHAAHSRESCHSMSFLEESRPHIRDLPDAPILAAHACAVVQSITTIGPARWWHSSRRALGGPFQALVRRISELGHAEVQQPGKLCVEILLPLRQSQIVGIEAIGQLELTRCLVECDVAQQNEEGDDGDERWVVDECGDAHGG